MILGLRFFTVYGPYGRPDMSIFKFSNLIKNKPIEVFNYGNHHRDFTYIDDCIDIVYKLIKFVIKKKFLNKSNFELLNVACGKKVSLKYLVSLLEKNYNKKIKKNINLYSSEMLKNFFRIHPKLKNMSVN